MLASCHGTCLSLAIYSILLQLQFDAYSLRGRQKKEQDESKDSKESTSISNYVPLYEGDGQEVKLTKDVVFTEPENGPLIYECGSNPPKKV